jgi:hypothetical protein
MHKKKEEGFIARRTEALALVLLSSRPDLTVMNAPDNAGVDIIVSIVRKRINAFNHFGVILKGTSHGIGNLQDASQALMSILPRKAAQGTLSMPICIFLFSMVGDHGYYTWLREPVANHGLPRLREPTSLHCKRLDQASLQVIIDEVNSYFDALSKVLVS